VASGESELVWTEERLEALEPQEHDFQEFKSSAYLFEEGSGRIRSDFLDNLSKQISAFANGAGGHLFLGLDDEGRVDGGIPTDLRGGTREWLEDVVGQLVDPHLKRFNAYAIAASGREGSRLRPGRAVFVLEVPTSEDAPHQARDRRYYLRIAGKSRPMAHRHILDIMHRSQHPEVLVERVDPFGEPELYDSDPRGPQALVRLRSTLYNHGKALAQHVGVEFILPRYAVGQESRRRTLLSREGALSQRPGEIIFFAYHPTPIFPTQRLPFGEVWITIHRNNVHHYEDGNVVLRWKAFADAAPCREGSVDVYSYTAVQRGIGMVRRALARAGAGR